METIRQAIEAVLMQERPATVRQIFYQLVSRGVIEKTEAEYKGTVCRLTAEMRRQGRIPYGWIADNTRWMRKPKSYSDLSDALEATQLHYRRALWDEQDVYVEIWSEKDAIAGVLFDVTRKWDVPLMVSRGFSSLSFLHSAAEQIESEDKPTYIYYFGDHDPSGVLIDKAIERTLLELAPDAEIYVERVAVLPWQIEKWDLPTRPTKTKGTHAKGFKGASVEVDAIPPGQLRDLCERCILTHIDDDAYQRTLDVERVEKETLAQMIERGLGGAA